MATISPLSRPSVTIENGNAITTSIDIAEFFEKQHHHVVQKIESLECSEQFLTRNFSRVKFEHRGNTYNAYQITKNGFVFLVMGFTGKKPPLSKKPTLLNSIAWKNNYGNRNNWPCLLLR